MSKFSDRLARAKADLGISTRAAADRAKAQGHRLSANSVSLYTRDGHPDPDGKTVKALAYALRVPEAELRELAGLPQQHGKFEPTPEADSLTAPQRAAVNEIIRLLADGNTGAGDGSGNATPMNEVGGTPATGADDGLGAFGHRDRGDLDHESVNDGSGENTEPLEDWRRKSRQKYGDNVRHLPETEYYTDPPPAESTAALYGPNRGRQMKEEQDRDAEGSQVPEDEETHPDGGE